MLSRCTKCNGSKKYLAMGAIHKDCDACKGIGQIEKPIKTNGLTNTIGTPVPARKRGRKPKQDILQAGV